MNKQKNKKKVIAFLLSVLMLISLFQNISYTPIAEGGETESVASESDAVASVGVEQDSAMDQQVENRVDVYAAPEGQEQLQVAASGISDNSGNFTTTGYKITLNDEAGTEITGDIYAGMDIKVKFEWQLADRIVEEGTYVIDSSALDAKGIKVNQCTNQPLFAEGYTTGSVGSYSVDANGTITVTITDTTYLTQTHNRSGYISFSGKIEQTDDVTKDGTTKNIHIGTYDNNFNYYLSNNESTASVDKQRSGKVTLNADGTYKQKYTVTIKANNGTVKDIDLSDVTSPAGKFSAAQNVKVAASTVANISGNYPDLSSAFSDIKNATFFKDQYVTLEYEMDVDPDIYDANAPEYSNTVSGTYVNNRSNTPKTVSDKETFWVSKPKIEKKATGYANGKVTWMITIYVGDQYDTAHPELSYYIRSVEDAYGYGLKKNGTTEQIDLSSFANQGGGTYTYTYETDVTDDVQNSLTDEQVKNKVSMETVKGKTYEGDASYTIVTKGVDVTKTYSSYDAVNKIVTWDVTVDKIPRGVTEITLIEDPSQWCVDQGQQELLKDENGTYSLAYIINGEAVTVDASNNLFIGGTQIGRLSGNNIIFEDTYAVPQPLNITVKTKIKDVSTLGKMYCNAVRVSYKSGTNTKTSDTKMAYFIDKTNLLTKTGTASSNSNSIDYKITIRVNPLDIEIGKKFEIKDVLPRGMVLSGPVKLSLWNTYNPVADLGESSLTHEGDENFSISLTVDDDFLAKYTSNVNSGGSFNIVATYNAKLKDEAKFITDGVSNDYENQASATYDGTSIGQDNTKTTLTPKSVIKKNASYTQSTAPYIFYSVDVNPDSLDLLPRSDELTATDKIGSALEFIDPSTMTSQSDRDKCKISVIDKATNTELTSADYSYTISSDKRTIQFKIPDGKHLEIKYAAYAEPETVLTPANSTNSFSLDGYTSDSTKATYSFDRKAFTPDGWATNRVGSIYIHKYWTDGNVQRALDGSVFRLESVVYDSTTRVVSKVVLNGKTSSVVEDNIKVDTADGLHEGYIKVDDLLLNQLYALYEIDADTGFALNREPYYFLVEGSSSSISVPAGTGSFKDDYAEALPYENVKAGTLIVTKSNIGNIDKDDAEQYIEFKVTNATTGTVVGTYKLGDQKFVYDPTTKTWTLTLNDLWPGTYTVEETHSDTATNTATSVKYSTDGGTTWTEGRRKDVTIASLQTDTIAFENTYANQNIQISKVSFVNGATKELAGATLKLYEGTVLDDSKCIDTWESTTSTHTILGTLLKANQIYTLAEVSAPTGYKTAQNITFKIGTDGKITDVQSAYASDESKIVMLDDQIKTVSISKKAIGNNAELAGAQMELYQGEYVTGTPVATWTTGNTAKVITIDATTSQTGGQITIAPGIYTLNEKAAPFGYELAESISFQVQADGTIYIKDTTGAYTVRVTNIVMRDKAQSFTISKYDVVNNKEVDGANLEILDGTTAVKRWSSSSISGPESFVVPGSFEADKEYVLRETLVPNGYDQADDIVFKFDVTGKLYIKNASNQFVEATDRKIQMVDNISIVKQIAISKVDSGTMLELAEAKLQIIKAEDGSVIVPTWTTVASSQKKIDVTSFVVGEEYQLVELEAPYGYDIAEPIVFKVDGNGDVLIKEGASFAPAANNTVIMKDLHKTITVSKVDATNSEKLDGAKLKITDASGTEVISWTTSKQQGIKPLDVLRYFRADTEYILTEVSAPTGYKIADEITFKVGTDNVLYIKGNDGNYTPVASGEIVMEDQREDITTATTTEEVTTETTETTEETTTEVTTTEATTTEETTTEVTTTETTTTEATTTEVTTTTEATTTEVTTTGTTTTTTTTTSSTTETKTGDSAPIEPITVVMLVAAVGIIVLGISRKKRNDK